MSKEMKPSDKRSYSEKLKDPRWQKMRLEILNRDEWACRCCGAKEKTLHVHHVHYNQSAEGPWDYPSTSLVTLCVDCHEYEGTFLAASRTLLIQRVVASGFWQASMIECLADAFCASEPLDFSEAGVFVAHINDLLESRNAALAKLRGESTDKFFVDGTKWEQFLKTTWIGSGAGEDDGQG